MNDSSPLRLAEITPDNVNDAIKVRVREDQDTFVAPVMYSLAEAYASRDTAWPRLVLDGDRPVAFVMAGFDPGAENPDHRCGIWRLNVAEGEQGKGYGRFAVEAVLAEARRRGEDKVTVSWVPGEGSPEGFYLKLGFALTDRVDDGETVGELFLA